MDLPEGDLAFLLGDRDFLLGDSEFLFGESVLFLGDLDLRMGDIDLRFGDLDLLLGDLDLCFGDLGLCFGDLDLCFDESNFFLGDTDLFLLFSGDLDLDFETGFCLRDLGSGEEDESLERRFGLGGDSLFFFTTLVATETVLRGSLSDESSRLGFLTGSSSDDSESDDP